MTTGSDDAALDLAAEVGPFFVLDRWTPDAGWRPMRELVDPDVIGERVAAARELLAERSRVGLDEIEERATASIVFLGLAARLVSPAVRRGRARRTGPGPAPRRALVEAGRRRSVAARPQLGRRVAGRRPRRRPRLAHPAADRRATARRIRAYVRGLPAGALGQCRVEPRRRADDAPHGPPRSRRGGDAARRASSSSTARWPARATSTRQGRRSYADRAACSTACRVPASAATACSTRRRPLREAPARWHHGE